MRRIGKVLVTAAISVVVLGAGSMATPVGASSGVPHPAELVSPPVPNTVDVFGQNAAGDIFYNRNVADPRGAVRHPDGSVTQLPKTLGGRGDLGPDGRLWLPLDGSLWAFGSDGSGTEYPITTASGTTTTGLTEVRSGVDGRIWFLDAQRSRIGSLETDGTGAAAVAVPGERGLEHLARGIDGRMWATRSVGTVHAVTPDLAVTTYPSIGKPVEGLTSNPSGVYAVTAGRLLRISPSGVAANVAMPVSSSVRGVPAASADGWIWIGGATVVSPSGRISQFAMPVEYTYAEFAGGGLIAYPDRLGVAGSQAGGFVGVVGQQLVRIEDPDVGVNLRVRASFTEAKGTKVMRVVATARTPGGAARSGTYDVRLGWNRYIPDGLLYIERTSRKIATVVIRDGTGTVDIPITPALVAGTPLPYTLDHGNCCTVSLRADGLSSIAVGVGSVQPSTTMQWLDRMNARALGRSMDTAGLVYWAGKLAARTPRATVTKSIVDSTAWRRQRVASAYQRWLKRKPDPKGLEYWQNWLKTHTTSDLDFALGTTAAGRDAGGTSNAARGKHLASALRLASASATQFTQQLDRGSSWSSVVRSAYFGSAAAQRRMSDLAPRSSFTPSLGDLVAEFVRTRDERGPLVKALATMP
jgi:hypothetical protein